MPRIATPTALPAPAAEPGAPPRVRRYDIDLLRVVCTAAVVLCHASAEFLHAGHRTAGIAGDSASRFAVPAFFAMAGWAALAGAPVADERQLLRRVGRVLRPMAVWTAVYLVWQYLSGPPLNGGLGKESVRALAGSVQPAFHLWYLYTYVPLVLLLGVAVLVVKGRALPRWSLLAVAGFAVAPALWGDARTLSGLNLPPWHWSVSRYSLGYAVAGAALLCARRLGPRPLWAAGVGVALLAVAGYQFTVRNPAPYGSPAVAALTLAVVGALAGVRVPARLRAALVRLSDASFGTYLVHLLFVMLLVRPVAERAPGGPAAAVALGVTALAAIAASFAASALWGRLGLRGWLG
ncbi:acyltransferase [Streptomyces sp. NPDC051940]|uniref:acyltransferase n=1 Tax=Streptomyces sp. NPDC051940 TaxID=3155675 RepID=UPI003432CD86